LPGSPDGVLIGLLPRSFCSSVACPACRIDHSSAYFLIPFAHQWLVRRIAHRLTSAHQWLARLARRSAHRLTSSFLPLISSLHGLPDRSLIGLLPYSFRSSVARQTDRSSANFLVSSAHQWLARQPAGRITHRLTSSFLPLISGSPDGSLIGLLPCSFHSSVTFPMAPWTDCSSAYFLVPSTRQLLSQQLLGRIAHRLTSSSFRSSMACRTDRSSAYFLVPSAHQWLA